MCRGKGFESRFPLQLLFFKIKHLVLKSCHDRHLAYSFNTKIVKNIAMQIEVRSSPTAKQKMKWGRMKITRLKVRRYTYLLGIIN